MGATTENTSDHVCPWWLAYTFDNFLRRLIHPPEATLAPYVRPGMRTADLGCGFGHFALGMAKLVGKSGRVQVVDVQRQMLDKTMKRARKQGLERRVSPVLVKPGDDLGVDPDLDFVLAANMLHEAPNLKDLLRQVYAGLKPGGVFYVMEPSGHITAQRFEDEVNAALTVGFIEVERPTLRRERCVVFTKPVIE